ncbi:MAG: hypothetical protein A3D56_01040 [Candidatus Taylorbacteria bacterium RIFCSPHIGHO2_02_FULL_45_35]|uniref:Uncharacterized protein n=1 Tax=Candidatus Taylorbacteria bacterium RIFCSPHIGHO2_02_FULL_45_35 TaxID=1802311 RepID=A0A1G2MPL7_9BACT|nr:MAG: hypothetical protein A3D56_01040 [Candidatus Taylorbacteria bacterium RIFCSPHIGHO2_02_FULL_45_35]OHA34341.1 MAG: hypothetical protein A3A22_00460 [Candidatus Taylorbacteria bacterium RIFCSPLOWO2_01_FULL_45_34b]
MTNPVFNLDGIPIRFQRCSLSDEDRKIVVGVVDDFFKKDGGAPNISHVFVEWDGADGVALRAFRIIQSGFPSFLIGSFKFKGTHELIKV